MSKLTKIVATIGPATESEEVIEKLIRAGMNVARFNTKHNDPQWHSSTMWKVRHVAERLGVPVALLLDLQGPEIRINLANNQEINVTNGQEVVFVSESTFGETESPKIPQIVIDSLSEGRKILIDDGLGEFEIVHRGGDRLYTRALCSFTIKNRKTLNTPGVMVELPSLIESDIVQLENAKNNGLEIEYVGLSFVRNGNDIAVLREKLNEIGLSSAIVAKIENQSSINHLEEIIDIADSIMIARGDLAVELPFQELTYWQKMIIKMCREKAKPVITATQMLKSMVDSPRPTRAEVSDVANAIYDATDAVMLSEETTVGQYPAEAVETQALIASFNEPHTKPANPDISDFNISDSITHAAISLLNHTSKKNQLSKELDGDEPVAEKSSIKIDKIVCLTETGNTVRVLARFRPKLPIHTLTSSDQTYRSLSLVYGVIPYKIELPSDRLESSDELRERIKNLGIAEVGETVLLVHGTFWKRPGLTNTLALIEIT